MIFSILALYESLIRHRFCVSLALCIALYIALLVVSRRKVYSDFWEEQYRTWRDAKGCSHLACLILTFSSLASLPFGVLHRLTVGPTTTGPQRTNAKGRIERWILFWAIMVPVLLFFSSDGWWPLLIFIPIERLTDVAHTLLRLFIRGAKPQNHARAGLFLLVHYGEVVMCFACFYRAAQIIAHARVLPSIAFRFSFGMATTLGAPDSVNCALTSAAVNPLMYLEIGCVLSLVFIDIPHVLSLQAERPTA